MGWIFIVVTALLGLYMAWTIGANDVANSMGCAVGSKAVSVKRAILIAGIFEFAGSVLVGASVTETVRNGIVEPQALADAPAVLALGMASALLASAAWLHLATALGMPVSTTHSIVGAVAGFGVVAAGWGAVHWNTMGQIVLSWFISPIAGGIVAFVFFKLILWSILGKDAPMRAVRKVIPLIVFLTITVVALSTIYKGLNHILTPDTWLTDRRALWISIGAGALAGLISYALIMAYMRDAAQLALPVQLERVERLFSPLVVLSACCVAFAHGANDVANAVGPLAAVADIVQTGTVKMEVRVPLWVLVLGGVGIVLGLATFGYRVMSTVGEKITQMTPSRAVAANIAAAGTVLVCSRMGLPVSTTHMIVGAVLGVGLARGLGAVNRDVTRNIFGSWLITVPAAAALAVVFFLVAKALLLGTVAGFLARTAG